jgi:hypothetical protein
MRFVIWLLGVTVTLAGVMQASRVAPGWVWVWWVWIGLWIFAGFALVVSSALRAVAGKRVAGGARPGLVSPRVPPAPQKEE